MSSRGFCICRSPRSCIRMKSGESGDLASSRSHGMLMDGRFSSHPALAVNISRFERFRAAKETVNYSIRLHLVTGRVLPSITLTEG